jgi:hypothetical protein
MAATIIMLLLFQPLSSALCVHPTHRHHCGRSCSPVLCAASAEPKTETPDIPTSAVGITGGDIWVGTRGISKDSLNDIADVACSTTITSPIITQYYPGRFWLWRRWRSTIVRRVLPDVVANMAFALLIGLILQQPGTNGLRFAKSENYLAGLAKVWQLSATMATFTLSFFLSQSYTLWRSVYSITRRVQGRLNDISLLCATYARRDRETGRFTPEAEELLTLIARWVRLWNMLFYASVTTRFAPLTTPQGLSVLVSAGALTQDERDGLLATSIGPETPLSWLSALIDRAIDDGRLGVSVSRRMGTSPIAVQMSLQNKLTELRATYASLPDALTGRMPLAYVQLVQILTDGLILATPFALAHSVGCAAVVSGTAIVTLFHSSIVNLAKSFLDPLNNEVEQRGGDPGIGGIEVATLLQETNLGSERWRKSLSWLPPQVQARSQRGTAEDSSAEPPPPPPTEPNLITRFFGGDKAADEMKEAYEQREKRRKQDRMDASGSAVSADADVVADVGSDTSEV